MYRASWWTYSYTDRTPNVFDRLVEPQLVGVLRKERGQAEGPMEFGLGCLKTHYTRRKMVMMLFDPIYLCVTRHYPSGWKKPSGARYLQQGRGHAVVSWYFNVRLYRLTGSIGHVCLSIPTPRDSISSGRFTKQTQVEEKIPRAVARTRRRELPGYPPHACSTKICILDTRSKTIIKFE